MFHCHVSFREVYAGTNLSDPPVCISELANKNFTLVVSKHVPFLLAQNDENHRIKFGHFEFPRHSQRHILRELDSGVF